MDEKYINSLDSIDFASNLVSAISMVLSLKAEDRIISPNDAALVGIKGALNLIFPDNNCINVLFTLNTDKQFFGVRVNPLMSATDAVVILSTDDVVSLDKYEIEFDSKLFDIGFTAEELAKLTIHEIGSMLMNPDVFVQIRSIIDSYALSDDDIISIRDSVNYSQLIIFVIKDTMYKLTSILYKGNDYFEDYRDIIEKINTNIIDIRSEKPVLIGWMIAMFNNMKINSGIIRDTLTDAKAFTGSKLELAEINKSLDALDKINSTLFLEESSLPLNKFFEKKNLSSLNEISIFRSLKKNGLRGIENDLYEYSMRAKNCTSAEDAYMIMRSINNRLGILEDYVYNEYLPPAEAKHWEYVIQQYKEIRYSLSKKKFDDKQYGLFFDYSKLDQLDQPNNY